MGAKIILLLLFFINVLISFRSHAQLINHNKFEPINDDTNSISKDGTDKEVMWLYEELDDTGLNAQNLCNYFDIYSNQLKIDCHSLQFVLKRRAIAQNHIIHKRDAVDEIDGGSGNGPDPDPEITSTTEFILTSSSDDITLTSDITDEQPATVSPTVDQETNETPYSSTTIKNEEANKKARKFNSKPESPKDVEEINDHQNNISNTLHPNEIVDDEKHINSMKKLETGNAEEPNPGESAENATKASKDTKILIVLFVAVVIIGIGAFLYNFVKKRRNSATITTDTNAQSTNEDPERGQEMKPLMKGKIENGDRQDHVKADIENEKNDNDKVTA